MRTLHHQVFVGVVIGFASLGCGGGGDEVSGVPDVRLTLADDYVVGMRGTTQLQLFVLDDKNNPITPTPQITWTSSNTSIVTIDAQGRAFGVALGGPVNVTATVSGKTATTRVTVRPASIGVFSPLGETVSIQRGQSVQFTAVARDADGAQIDAGATSWSITPTSVATVTSTGLVTGVTTGGFTISASIGGATGSVLGGVPGTYDGTWEGSAINGNGQPQLVRFTVRFDTLTLFTLPEVPTNCGPTFTTTFTRIPLVPIVNGTFNYNVTFQQPPLTGTFSSTSAVAGSYPDMQPGAVTCPQGGSSGRVVAGSAFTATRQ